MYGREPPHPEHRACSYGFSDLCRVSSRICRVLWLGSGSSPSTMALREVLSRPAWMKCGSSLRSSRLPLMPMRSARKQ